MPSIRVTQIAFALFLAAFAIWGVANDLQARRVLVYGDLIQHNTKVRLEDGDILDLLPDGMKLSCRRDIQTAAMTVQLAIIEASLKDRSAIKRLDRTYLDLQQGFRRFLSCFPYNGNAWMRLAMVTTRMEGPVPKVVDEAEMSSLLAPKEAWILGPRIAFLSSLALTGIPRVEGLLNRDLDTMFRGVPHQQIGYIYRGLGPKGRERMRVRFDAVNQSYVAAENPNRLRQILHELNVQVHDETCIKYFYALKTCASKS